MKVDSALGAVCAEECFSLNPRPKISFFLQKDIHLIGAFFHFGSVQDGSWFTNRIGPKHSPGLTLGGRAILFFSAGVFLIAFYTGPSLIRLQFLFINQ
jgi:hypothetical protein